MTKVLLITYYWPPSGGVGVQRWLKMSKYLIDEDIDLTVYTAENPQYSVIDQQLAEQINPKIKVIKKKIFEPHNLYKFFTRKSKDKKFVPGELKKNTLKERISLYIRSNWFIPDARALWVGPSTRFLKKLHNKKQFDVVISTSPPHSMHLIALNLKKAFPALKWIADFRDPWTGYYVFDQLNLTKKAKQKHKKLEKQVLCKADHVVAIGWTMAEEFEKIAHRPIDIIPNGYDHPDFEGDIEVDKDFSINYFGTMGEDRNPDVLWKSLEIIKKKYPAIFAGIKINITGQITEEVLQKTPEYVNIHPYLPHSEAVSKIRSSPVLLLIIPNTPPANKGILTGKAFEYLGAKRPVLCIGPKQGDVKKLFAPYDHIHYLCYSEVSGCVEAIVELYENFRNKSDRNIDIDPSVYSRKSLARRFAKIIKD